MATAPGITTLTDLCGKRIKIGNILVITNIPKKTTSKALEGYIEAVCGVSKPRVHYYERQVAVVETDSELQDVKIYNQLVDTVIKFESGCGVFIKGIPDADVCTETDIFLYFDSNKESGGWQGCVEEVEPPTHVGHTKYAVVRLKHVKALKCILNKREHKLCNQVVEIEPYFPSYHDDLLAKLASQQTGSALAVEDVCTKDHIEQFLCTPVYPDVCSEQHMHMPIHADYQRYEHSEQHRTMPVHVEALGKDHSDNFMSTPVPSDVRIKHTPVQDDQSCPEVSDMSDLKTIYFELHGGEAKYFQKNIEPKIRELLRGTKGKLVTKVEKKHEPMILSVFLEGDNNVTMETKKRKERIWHENVDLRRISRNDRENKLLLMGLDGDSGRQMFRQFQKDEHCIVYVTKPDTSATAERNTHNNRPLSYRQESKEEIVFKQEPERHHRLQRRLTDEHAQEESIRHLQTPIDEPITKRPEEIRNRELHEDITIDVGKKSIVLRQGDITKQKASVLVNILGPSNSMNGDTAIGKAFLQAGRQELLNTFEEVSTSTYESSSLKNLTITPSIGTLRQEVKIIVHVTLPKLPRQSKCDQAVISVMAQLFEVCETYGYTYIAIPPLCIGKMYRYSVVANIMLRESAKYLKGRTYLKEIKVVVYDEKTYDVFKQTFSAYSQNVGDGKMAFGGHDTGARPKTRQMYGINVDRLSPCQVLRSSSLPVFPLFEGQNHHRENQRNIQPAKNKKTNHHGLEAVHVLRRQRSNSLDGQNPREEPTRPQMSKNQQQSMPQSRSILKVEIFAEGKENCDRARSNLSKKMKEEFLYEEKMEKKAISKDAKAKIAKVVSRSRIESIKGKDDKTIILKGNKTQVNDAHKEILAIVVRDLSSSSGDHDEPRPRRPVHRRETREFISDMVKDEPKTPSYWTHFQPGEIVKNVISKVVLFVQGNSYKLVTLDKGDPIYRDIIAMTKKTWDVSKLGKGADAKGIVQENYTRMKVKKIERVENIKSYNKYAVNRKDRFVDLMHKGSAKYCPIGKLKSCNGHVATALHDNSKLLQDMYSELNEYYFFHGTKPENVQVVCNQGLDPKLASGNAMLGQGIYGAESSIKADQYADDALSRSSGNGNEKKMFLIRMLLGNAFVCNAPNPHKYCRPPCTGRDCYKDNCKTHQFNFDSVLSDNGKMFREFVVYESSQSYPEYLITYVRL